MRAPAESTGLLPGGISRVRGHLSPYVSSGLCALAMRVQPPAFLPSEARRSTGAALPHACCYFVTGDVWAGPWWSDERWLTQIRSTTFEPASLNISAFSELPECQGLPQPNIGFTGGRRASRGLMAVYIEW